MTKISWVNLNPCHTLSKATNKGKGKGKWNQEDKLKKYCNHCKIMGHETSKYWKLKKEQEAKAANTTKLTAPTPATMAKIVNANEPHTINQRLHHNS
jgi:hypothetical protein